MRGLDLLIGSFESFGCDLHAHAIGAALFWVFWEGKGGKCFWGMVSFWF